MFLIGNTFSSLPFQKSEKFSVGPKRQYFPLVRFALGENARFCLNAKSFKFDAFSHFRSGL